MRIPFFMILAGVLSFAAEKSHSAGEPLVAYIDMQRAIQETTTGKDAKKKLEKEFNAKKAELEKKRGEIEKMAEDLEKKKVALSDEVRNQKAAEIQQNAMKLQQEAMKSEQEFRKKEQEMTRPIVEKIQKAIDKISQERGLAMVIERGTAQQVVIWAKKELDITEDVLKAYEKAK